MRTAPSGLRAILFGLAIAVLSSSRAVLAQSVDYTSVVAVGSKPVQLTYHASAHKNCAPAVPPEIKVLDPPTNGTLIVRKGKLTTDKFAGCGRIQVPVQVVFYRAKDGYVGADHVVYEVMGINGAITKYDIKIRVNPPPGAIAPPKAQLQAAPTGRAI
jgi:hypothetical protein